MAFLFSGLAIAISTSLMRRALRTSQRKQKELEHEIAVRQKAEKSLQEAQAQLRQHASLLEKRVAERTRYLRETILSLEGVCYHLAHDLRAPLRAMDGFTSLLLSECSSSLDETGQCYAGKIVQAAKRMDLLIDGLMEYGRLGHEYYPIEPIQAKIMVKRALSQLNQDSQDSLVTLGTSWPEVLGNLALLELVFYQLLNNALKFIRPRVVPRIRVWIEGRSPWARIWVEDNGIGLPMEYADKVFGIFQRLHPTEQYPGTGMGLAIVAKAVSRMKGHVGVESNLHEGSRFWFELPLAPNNIFIPASEEPQLEDNRLLPA
jgi:signal transduction histidine kinase